MDLSYQDNVSGKRMISLDLSVIGYLPLPKFSVWAIKREPCGICFCILFMFRAKIVLDDVCFMYPAFSKKSVGT